MWQIWRAWIQNQWIFLNEAESSMNLLHCSNVLKSRVSTESVWVRHRFVHQLSPYTEDLRPLPGMTLHTFWTHGTQTDTTKNCTDAQASAMLKNLALLFHWNTSNTEHVKLYTSTVYWEDMKCLVNHILSQNKQYISISISTWRPETSWNCLYNHVFEASVAWALCNCSKRYASQVVRHLFLGLFGWALFSDTWQMCSHTLVSWS